MTFLGGTTSGKLQMTMPGEGQRDDPQRLFTNLEKLDVYLSHMAKILIVDSYLYPHTETYVYHNATEPEGKLKSMTISGLPEGDIQIDCLYDDEIGTNTGFPYKFRKEIITFQDKTYETTFTYYQSGMNIPGEGEVSEKNIGKLYTKELIIKE